MWIKICGLTTHDAVAAAVDAEVTAIGFVFSPSVRRVAPAEAAALAAYARGRVRCVAVFRHPSQAEVDEVLDRFRPDVLQTDAADLASLRLPRSLALLPVFRAGGGAAAPLPQRLLFEGPESGSGTATDWAEARGLARSAQLVLAGGLSAENVAAAIAEVRPFGVDVSSGVEARKGVKSPAGIARFAASARAAFARIAA
ncbi:MAG TPA: phosphoribosylanthranilate isomerase [Steroidobacteraceae bacterium]|nr:phosphoribosylanthranilate isomerase [Steroidobacteraceae bacterium]